MLRSTPIERARPGTCGRTPYRVLKTLPGAEPAGWSSRELAEERFLGREQRRCHPAAPLHLAGRQLNQILADLDLDMRNAATLAMVRQGVANPVLPGVGLVVACDQTCLGTQGFEEAFREARVSVVEHRGMHLAAHTLEHVRHAVLNDQNRAPARGLALLQQGAEMLVIRLEDLALACTHLFNGE